MPAPTSHQAGFTIVEILVAVVVFAVGLTAVAGMQTRSLEQATFSDQMSMRVNVLTHWAETLTRQPVREETVEIDQERLINVQISDLYKETNMCEYGKTCDWADFEYDDKKAHTLRYRITQGYPLPNLIMIEMEVAPTGVSASEAQRRTIRNAFVRSSRWN